MRRILLHLVLALVPATALAGPISAQEIDSPYRFIETRRELAIFGGWMAPAEGRFGYGPQAGPAVGARFGVSVTGPLELEVDLGWATLTRDVIDPTPEAGPATVGEADVGQYHALLRLQAPITGRRTWHGIQPALWTGLGLRGDYRGTQTADLAIAEQYRYESGTQFAATFGGMLRLVVADRWAVRLEGGALLYRLDTPGGYSEDALGFEAVGQNEWVTAPTFGLSLGYRF